MSTYKKTVFENGLNVASEKLEGIDTVAIAVSVDVGARHEQESDSGISHLLEHMAFKGTTRRTARRKTLELDRMRDRVARNEALLAATVSAQPKNPPGFAMPKTPDQWNVALGQCLRDERGVGVGGGLLLQHQRAEAAGP